MSEEKNDFELAFERIADDASYGIRSDDHEIMNPENYKKQMKQHYEDVELVKRLIDSKASQFKMIDGMITRYDELFVDYNKLQDRIKQLEFEKKALQGLIDGQAIIIKELEEKLTWKPIETAPRDGARILIRCEFYNTCFIAFYNNNKWESDDSNRRIKPTHWLPIPEYKEK